MTATVTTAASSPEPKSAAEPQAAAPSAKDPNFALTGASAGRNQLLAGLIDLAFLALAGMVALSGFGPAFGGTYYLVVGGAGLLFGLAVAWLAAARGWALWVLGLLVLAGFLLLGGPLVVPSQTYFGFLPGKSLGTLAKGAIQGWPNLVTTANPVGNAQSLLTVPWISGVLCGALSMTIARRAGRWAVAAVLPAFAVLVAAVLMGDTKPAWPFQASVLVVLLLLWGSIRQRSARTAGTGLSGGYRWIGAVSVLLVASLLGHIIGSSNLFTGKPPSRWVARDEIEPPLDMRQFPSPLEGFRKYRSPSLEKKTMFSVTGLREGESLRLATLDTYDGVVWNVRDSASAATPEALFQRVGQTVPTPDAGEKRKITVEVGDYSGPWVPNLGATSSVTFSGSKNRTVELQDGFRYNLLTNTAAQPGGIKSGDSYEMEVKVPPQADPAAPGKGDSRANVGTQAEVTALEAWPGADVTGSPLEQARAIAQKFKTSKGESGEPVCCFFSNGVSEPPKQGEVASLPGHGQGRLTDFIKPPDGNIIGNEEQYAAAMAGLAAKLGLPARVVMGFTPPPGKIDPKGKTQITGADVDAWVEVAVEGQGWVPLDPTNENPKPPTKILSNVPPPDPLIQPPPPTSTTIPQSASGAGAEDCKNPEDCPKPPTCPRAAVECIPAPIRTVARFALPPLLILAGVTGAMAGLKGRRRKKRRLDGLPADRVAAGWDEVCDLARDLGDVVPDMATRREAAVMLGRPGIAALARSADTVVFGPGLVDEVGVVAYWSEVDLTRSAMLDAVSPVDRWKATVNPSSLRYKTERGPVQFASSRMPAWLRNLRPKSRAVAT